MDDELLGIIEQITPLLRKVNATRLNPLITEVGNKTFFDVWLDEEGMVQASRRYDKIN